MDEAKASIEPARQEGAAATPAYDALMDLLRKRRSGRSFTPDPIPEGYAEKIIDAARWAMSGSNSQPWDFVLVRDRDRIRALHEAYMEHDTYLNFWLEQRFPPELRHPAYRVEGTTEEQLKRIMAREGWRSAPAVIAVLGDGRRQMSVSATALPGRGVTNYEQGLSNAATLIHLAAAALGLCSEWVTMHIQEPFKKILDAPVVLNLHSLIPIGYPPQKLSGIYRRKLADVLHYETYDHSRLMSDPEIAEYYFEHRNKTVRTYIRSHGEAAPNVDDIWQKIGKPGIRDSSDES